MRDLEGALDLEKNTKLEAMASTEKLNTQLRSLHAVNVQSCHRYHKSKYKMTSVYRFWYSDNVFLCRDLQQIYDEERKLSLETKEKLEK